MARLILGLALALGLAGCNTTGESPQQASVESATTAAALEPSAGSEAADEPQAEPGPDATVVDEPAATVAQAELSEVDRAAQDYLTCVVGRAAQSAEAGESHDNAVELGVDSCRNQFREARWAYKDTGASDEAADRYGVNLLTYVRNEARNFLDAAVQ